MHRSCGILLVVLMFAPLAGAAPKPRTFQIKVGRDTREALVYAPEAATAAPLVFVFHGHGGTAEKAAESFDIQKHWPQAIVVYMQGLPIVSTTDPDGKKAGWQHEKGELDDRDLKFFDATLARVRKEHKVDEARVYATGHSNGGGFTYLLWAARGDLLAAVAPSAASSANHYLKDLKPKPALHIAGKKDETAPYAMQRKLMDSVRTLNGCAPEGKPWHKLGTIYPSAGNTPFVEAIHSGGHDFWDESPKLIVSFFKEHHK